MTPLLNKIIDHAALNTWLLSGVIIILVAIYLTQVYNRRAVMFKLKDKSPTEEAIQLKHLVAAFEHVEIVTVVADIDGKILYVNDMVERILFWKPEELLSKNILVFIPERFHEPHQAGMRKFQATHQGEILNQTINMFSLVKGGQEIPVELTVEKKEEAGKTYIIGLIRDMSKYNAKINALEKLILFYKRSERLIGMGCFECNVIEGTVFMSDNMKNIFDVPDDQNNLPISITSDRIISTDQSRVADIVATAVEAKENYEVDFFLKNNKHIRVVAGMEFDNYNEVTIIQGALRVLPA